MVQLALPLISTFLVLVLLLSGGKQRLVRHYPMFYGYLLCVLLSSLVRLWCWMAAPALYLPVYWYSQYLCVALGFGVIWEIYGKMFENFPGTARMARFLVTFALAAVFVNGLIHLLAWEATGLTRVAELEMNMRWVQAILLSLSMALAFYYEIPMGLNSAGILFGYGCFITVGVLTLTLREILGRDFYPVLSIVRTAAYPLTLALWLYALRAYHPAPAPQYEPEIAADYPLRARSAVASMARIRSSLGRALEL